MARAYRYPYVNGETVVFGEAESVAASSCRDNRAVAVLTIPNAISFARLLGVPVLVWLGFSAAADFWLFVLFVVSGFTDWLDGFLARKLQQFSDLGAALDPIADRLYILAALVVLLKRELVPLWVVAAILVRDLFMLILIARLRALGFAAPGVHYLGKAGTMMLLWSIPLVFLAQTPWQGQGIVRAFAFAFLGWGLATYWAAGWIYLRQFLQVSRTAVS